MVENPEVKMKELLTKHALGQMSFAELEVECAYWFLDTLDTLQVIGFPSPPAEYAEYQVMTFKEKSKIPSDFWQQGKVRDYLDTRSKISAQNYANLCNMKDHKLKIPEGDVVGHAKFQEAINDFEERMRYIN